MPPRRLSWLYVVVSPTRTSSSLVHRAGNSFGFRPPLLGVGKLTVPDGLIICRIVGTMEGGWMLGDATVSDIFSCNLGRAAEIKFFGQKPSSSLSFSLSSSSPSRALTITSLPSEQEANIREMGGRRGSTDAARSISGLQAKGDDCGEAGNQRFFHIRDNFVRLFIGSKVGFNITTTGAARFPRPVSVRQENAGSVLSWQCE